MKSKGLNNRNTITINMKTSSCKAKGRKLQQYVRDKILEAFPELTNRDVMSTPMGVSGDDILLSELGIDKFPYSVECKNQEKLNIWGALSQIVKRDKGFTGLLVFKRNNTEPYCVLKFDDFMQLVKHKK